jgi:hemoglobin/transferrin/lactoferrin receptor protein
MAVGATPLAAQEETSGGFLGTLVLTGGKRDIAVGSAVSQTVVDEEEIQDRQASTVAQLVDAIPGVTLLNGATPQGSAITIRGFGANNSFGSDQKVAIQVDGASVGSEELYRVGTQMFTDPLLYRKVEVLRGTIGSFAYGSGVVGGVLKMETKNASDFTGGVPGFALGQSLEFNSNKEGFASSTTFAWQPNESAEFLLNYTHRKAGNYEAGDGKAVTNSKFETPSYLVKGKFTFGQDNDHSLTFSTQSTVSDEKDVPYDQFGTTGGAFGKVDRKTDTRQSVIEYNWNPSSSDFINLTANLSYADQKIDMTSVPYSARSALRNANHRYQTTKLKVSNKAEFATGGISHNLDMGIELIKRDRADMVLASAPGGTDNRFAFYAIDEMSIGNLTVTPALRYETSTIEASSVRALTGNAKAKYENDAWMGGLAAAYDFDSGFSVFGSAAYTEGLPIIDDLGTSFRNFTRISATYDKRAQTTEKSRTFELGASYTGDDVFGTGDSLTVRGNIYKTKMWDITSYAGLGKVETEGFELEASYNVASGLYFDLGMHVGEGKEYTTAGTGRTWRNEAADRTSLTIGKKWGDTVDLSWEVVNNRDVRIQSGRSYAAAADTTVHNLRATYRPSGGALEGTEVRFGIENLTDLDYNGHLSSASRKAPGRTFKLGLSKVF